MPNDKRLWISRDEGGDAALWLTKEQPQPYRNGFFVPDGNEFWRMWLVEPMRRALGLPDPKPGECLEVRRG